MVAFCLVDPVGRVLLEKLVHDVRLDNLVIQLDQDLKKGVELLKEGGVNREEALFQHRELGQAMVREMLQ